MGYHWAGFEMTGVDNRPQPRYPFEFVQADALEYVTKYGHLYDFIHASPPCQPFSTIAKQQVVRGNLGADAYEDLIEPTRELLMTSGKPYVIENVRGAPLKTMIQLCGSSFGLDVRRHRLFESNLLLFGMPCDHSWQTPRFRSLDKRRDTLASVVGVYGHCNYAGELHVRRAAMGIDWMSADELSEAIPPAYTEFIGEQLIWHLEGAA